jgi:hypothetical protein
MITVVIGVFTISFCTIDKASKNSTRIYAWYPSRTKYIQVIVEFDSMNGSAWCDDIDLWVEVPSGSWYWAT